MKPIFIAVAFTFMALSFGGCSKEQETKATLLTGTWMRGTNAGDTLIFTINNDKNVLRYNNSFNPALPANTETEYKYQQSKLSLRNFMTAQNDFYIIQSFKWNQEGKEFEVLGYEIFPFMSSTITRFTYKKVN